MEIQSRVLEELWQWDREVLGALEKRIKSARRELERCRRAVISQKIDKQRTPVAL
jgi:hypothetical protein